MPSGVRGTLENSALLLLLLFFKIVHQETGLDYIIYTHALNDLLPIIFCMESIAAFVYLLNCRRPGLKSNKQIIADKSNA